MKVADAACYAERSSTQAEDDILHLVVDLDKDRILSIAKKIEKRGIRDLLLKTHSGLLAGQVKPEIWAQPRLKPWLESCPFTAASFQSGSAATLIMQMIEWAWQARSLYSEQLQSLLGFERTQKPPWVESLHKIARYRSAIKSMVKLATKQPEVFASIHIEEVKALDSRPFSLLKVKAPLQEALKNLVKEDSEVVTEQLEKHLGTQDVEALLRKKCRLDLTLHAEMQLTVFYEGNPSLVPRLPFIGTSKKACFLCHEYLLQHPLKLQVSACHQKIYPSWMPPPHYQLPGRYKNTPFMKLGKKIEQLTKRDLRTALNAPRRPRNQDSTAGPSLTITTTVSMGLGSL